MWYNSKTQNVTKLNVWQISKKQLVTISNPQIVTKLKNSNCDDLQKLKLWQNYKIKNSDKTKKLKLWQNSKTRIVTKLKKSNCDKTQKTQIVTKLENSNCD